MSSQANIIINLQDKNAQAQLQRLANSFNQVGASSNTATGNMVQGLKQASAQAQKTGNSINAINSATGSLDKTLAKFGGMLLTMEMAKKVAAYADATLSAAASNERLSESVRQSAKEYVEIKKNVGQIGEGLVLVSAQVATNMAKVSGLSDFLKEQGDFWTTGGIDQTILNDLNKEIESTKARAKKASEERKQNEKDEADLKAKNEADRLAAIKREKEARLASLQSVAEKVKANFGTDIDIIDRVYDKDLSALNKTLRAKLISQSEYEDASAKLLEDRNKRVREAQRANETDYSPSGYDGDLAKKAEDRARAESEKRLAWEAQAQADLMALRTTSATSEVDRLAIEREKIDEHYKELAEKYKDNAQVQIEIEKAKSKEIADNDKKLADIQDETRKQSVDTFLNGYTSLFSTLAQQNKKWAVAAKTTAITSAIVNTAEGVTKAYAQGGVLGLISGLGVGAAGAAQIATIKNQKFANGGIVDGSSYTGDRVPVSVNSGEMILNATQQAQLFKVANGANSATQPINMTINVANGMTSSDVKKALLDNRDAINKMVASALNGRKMSSVGVLI